MSDKHEQVAIRSALEAMQGCPHRAFRKFVL